MPAAFLLSMLIAKAFNQSSVVIALIMSGPLVFGDAPEGMP
jgi:hypothetical protein